MLPQGISSPVICYWIWPFVDWSHTKTGKESTLGALGNLLREVLILKFYLISFSRATNQ